MTYLRSAFPHMVFFVASFIAASRLIAAADPVAPSAKFAPDGQTRVLRPWASSELVTSPVAITFDGRGDLYVAETARAGNAAADTRGMEHLNAVEEDLWMRSVDDRLAQIRRWTAAQKFPSDYFTRTEDRVRVVRDSNGDGVADVSGVFADGFNGEVDGIGAGVLWLGDTLYYTCIPSLWAMRDRDADLKADGREAISSGYGVRWCFAGHDLHGLVEGPDGRVYFSMGDRGYNVTTKEGLRFVGTDRGAVFRCRPDGSQLELIHQGLRNPQELAFNELGDLFTGDNNSDSGDKARLVQIVEGGDSGWRQDVQSLPSRGPWNREFMWDPQPSEPAGAGAPAAEIKRPAWALPPIAHVGAGPSGLAMYPGFGEISRYDGCLFLVDFYGSGSKVHALKLEPRGGGYSLAEHTVYFEGTATVTDIAWGYDGRLYLSDWGGGWQPNPNGGVFTISNPAVLSPPEATARIARTQARFARGFQSEDTKDLLFSLGDRDARIRAAAQRELSRRALAQSGEILAGLIAVTQAPAAASLASDPRAVDRPDLRRIHAIWALWPLADREVSRRAAPAPATDAIWKLSRDPLAEIRCQAVRILGDIREPSDPARLLELLADASPRVVRAAALAVGRIRHGAAIPALLDALDRNADRDPILRQSLVHAMVLINQPSAMMDGIESRPRTSRLGVVLALRSLLGDRPSTPQPEDVASGSDLSSVRLIGRFLGGFLADPDPGIVTESARAIYDMRAAEALPLLGAMLDHELPASLQNEALLRRAIEANVADAAIADAARLARFAARAEVGAKWRTLAIQRLAGWDAPLRREGVWGNWLGRPALLREPLVAAARKFVDAMRVAEASTPDHELRREIDRLDAMYAFSLSPPSEAPPDSWPALAQLADASRSAAFRAAMLERVTRDFPAQAPRAALTLWRTAEDPALREQALMLVGRDNPAQTAVLLREIMNTGSMREKQAVIAALVPRRSKRAADDAESGVPISVYASNFILSLAGRADGDKLDSTIALDFYEAASRLPATHPARATADRLATQGQRPKGFSDRLLSAGGDPDRGREIFLNHDAAECLRCHAVQGEGGADRATAGPNLDGVASRRTVAQLVESVVEPNARVDPAYGQTSAMPLMTGILTPHEIRDVVAYLATLHDPRAIASDERTHESLPARGEHQPSGSGDPDGVGHGPTGSSFPFSSVSTVIAFLVVAFGWRGVRRAGTGR